MGQIGGGLGNSRTEYAGCLSGKLSSSKGAFEAVESVSNSGECEN